MGKSTQALVARGAINYEHDFAWTAKVEEALVLMAEDLMTDTEIAVHLKIGRRSLSHWKAHPEFRRRLNEKLAKLADGVLRKGIARKEKRLEALQDRWDRCKQIIEERAADQSLRGIPGGETGLLLRQVKSVGKPAKMVEEYVVDVALLREMREMEKQAALELGDWTEHHEVTGEIKGTIHVLHQAMLKAYGGEATIEATLVTETNGNGHVPALARGD